MKFLKNYRIHKADSQASSKRSHKSQCPIIPLWYQWRKHCYKGTTWCRKFIWSYCIHIAVWQFKTVVQRSTSNLAEIFMWKILPPVKLQHDAGKFLELITFTRCCHPLSFDHALPVTVKCRFIWTGHLWQLVVSWSGWQRYKMMNGSAAV